ncbi:MAG: hypothetical protein LUG21_01040 [Clostridiales bacterium]|nr:hypothetical protein [Clostridiales bacterium]
MKKNNASIRKNRKIPHKFSQTGVMVFVVLMICIYVFIECYGAFNVSLKTQTALVSTVYNTLDSQALIIRDEHSITGTEGKITVPSVADCEKVKNGGEIAKVFSTEENAKIYSDYLRLESEMEYYADMESKSVGQVTDVESLDKDILNDINALIRAEAAGQSSDISEYSDDLNDKFTRRQILIGQDVDFSSVIKELEQEMKSLNVSSAKPSGYITADSSGIFSQYSDGLESAFDYGSVETLDTETLNSYISQAQNASQSSGIGKLITSFEWYFCISASAGDVESLKNGSKVDVAVKGSDKIYSCTIVSGAETDLNTQDTVLVLMCDDMNSDIASMRLANVEIRLNSYKGIKVPSEAVHINDEEKGVYVLVSSVVKWRKADVIYTGSDYVVLNYEPDLENGIKLYDQIIIQGKDLHDGKVYT